MKYDIFLEGEMGKGKGSFLRVFSPDKPLKKEEEEEGGGLPPMEGQGNLVEAPERFLDF